MQRTSTLADARAAIGLRVFIAAVAVAVAAAIAIPAFLLPASPAAAQPSGRGDGGGTMVSPVNPANRKHQVTPVRRPPRRKVRPPKRKSAPAPPVPPVVVVPRPPAPGTRWGIVIKPVYLRVGPSKSAAKIRQLSRNTPLRLVGEQNGYYQAITEKGRRGYVAKVCIYVQ